MHNLHVCKTLTDLQILGCKLHQNAFGGQALPGPAGGAIALSQTPSHYYYYYFFIPQVVKIPGVKNCKS